MQLTGVLFLSVLYAASGICMAISTAHSFKIHPEKRYFNIARVMYIIIYSVVPALVHYYVYNNGTVGHQYEVLEYDSKGLCRFYLAWIMSVIGYLGLLFGNRAVIRTDKRNWNEVFENRDDKIQYDIEHSYTAWLLTAIICLIVGLVSHIIWTIAYGGIVGILEYASALRSGWDTGINNSYTVFKRFVPLVQFANIVLVALAVYYKRLFPFVLSIPALVLSILYLLANDGRAPLVMHIVAIVWVIYKLSGLQEKKIRKSSLILMAMGATIALFLMHNSDSITKYILSGGQTGLEISFDILSSIRTEFCFTVRNGQSIFYYLDEHPLTFRLPKEIISGILGILPSAFRSESIEKLEILNTYYWRIGTSGHFGGCPPDIVVTGIYTMNYLGVFVLPALYGKILSYIDRNRQGICMFDNEVFFALIFYPVIRTIGYANFDGVMLNIFYILFGYVVLWCVERISIGGKTIR